MTNKRGIIIASKRRCNPSKRGIMHRTNRLAREALMERGFNSFRAFPHGRYDKDIYGWDGVCKRNGKVYWYKFKTGYIPAKAKKRLMAFCCESGQKGIWVERITSKRLSHRSKGAMKVGRGKVKVTVIGEVEV